MGGFRLLVWQRGLFGCAKKAVRGKFSLNQQLNGANISSLHLTHIC